VFSKAKEHNIYVNTALKIRHNKGQRFVLHSIKMRAVTFGSSEA